MQWKNTEQRYGSVAMFLHWGIALGILALIGLGLYMTSLPDGNDKWDFYSLHKSIGMLVFLFIVMRILWRIRSIVPPLPAGLKTVETLLARLTHGLIYLAMVLIPISGYVDSSAGGYKLKFFGLFDVPKIIEKDKALEQLSLAVHEWTAYLLITLILLHAGAAFKHHFVYKDDTLRRMLPILRK